MQKRASQSENRSLQLSTVSTNHHAAICNDNSQSDRQAAAGPSQAICTSRGASRSNGKQTIPSVAEGSMQLEAAATAAQLLPIEWIGLNREPRSRSQG